MPTPHVNPMDGSDVDSWAAPDGTNIGARFDSFGRRRNGTTGAPTVAVGAGAGSGATASVAGTDEFGVVTVNTGTSSAAGTLATVTFNQGFKTAPIVSIDAGDAVSAAAQLYYTSTTATLVIKTAAIPTASTSGLKIAYMNVGGA